MYNYLNERVINIEKENLPFVTTTVPQTYATTTSLALVTIFRAAAVASLGLSFTQSMWKKLRDEFIEVGHIEELFQIRANAFRLFNMTIIRSWPILSLIATISWLVPVALIYPPGSLVVGIEYRHIPIQFNASVIPKDNMDFSYFKTGNDKLYETGLATVQVDGNETICKPPWKSFCVYM